ncbi:MAG: pyridoxamine 5'-phosphate oxidase [Flammeovirgaceae bacterium]|nr:pyridoxamine 5'-phosphate oxidase [Flammeovirgaceae bacterium]
MIENLHSMRIDYSGKDLIKKKFKKNPIKQFNLWFQEAIKFKIKEPNAMILSTIKKKNKPTSRTVLLKEVDNKGFIFFTNYNSNKGVEIKNNKNVSLNFLWKNMERQIIIEGITKRISEISSINYFNKRPRDSQISAWVSDQSKKIKNKTVLENQYKKMVKKFQKIKVIPKPTYWGGYIVLPNKMEFWQGKKSRLHDRICYKLINKDWKKFRLSP